MSEGSTGGITHHIKDLVRTALLEAVRTGSAGKLTPFGIEDSVGTWRIERPRDAGHGDWSTNAALALAGMASMSPRELAQTIVHHLADDPHIAAVEIAGPGFINFRLSEASVHDVLRSIVGEGAAFGRSALGSGTKVQVEFVSANPVGPMHVGHGRWAAVGDSLARVLEAAGYDVQREFYINDAGTQMDVFGRSVAARYMQALGHEVTFPEDGYQGAYIAEIAAEIIEADGEKYSAMTDEERSAALRDRAYVQVLEHLKQTLERFGVTFGVWFSERTLHAGDALEAAVADLREAGFAFDHEGAVWFRSTDPRLVESNAAAGGGAAPWPADDKDRVLIRSTGEPTYLCADIAYHRDKFERGFDRVIDIWGADHHGYVPRMMAAAAALGHPGQLEVIIGQLVNLLRGGEPVRMSKRTGEMVTFEELIDEVGVDAARYFFLMRSTDTALDFDIELAKQKTQDNPVYYVQYAHARISSIVRHAEERGMKVDPGADVSRLTEDAELGLAKELARLPDLVELCAAQRAPYKLTGYAEGVAKAFHRFYTKHRVVTKDEARSSARLVLCEATRIVLANVLGLLGVTAPERM